MSQWNTIGNIAAHADYLASSAKALSKLTRKTAWLCYQA